MTAPIVAAFAMAVLAAPAPSAVVAPAPEAVSSTPPGEQPVDPYVQSSANAGATPLGDAATFRAFHGLAGVQRIASTFVDRSEADPRIKDIFAAADTPRLKRTFAEQLCYLLGGGCAYTGRDMRAAHKGQGLQDADFNAVVENLQAAMDREHVRFHAQNVLLAKLAPMQRSIVERKSPAILARLARRIASLHSGS